MRIAYKKVVHLLIPLVIFQQKLSKLFGVLLSLIIYGKVFFFRASTVHGDILNIIIRDLF